MRQHATTSILLALTCVAAGAQTGQLDQDNTATTNIASSMGFAPFVYEQVVEVGQNGQLEGFVLRVAETNALVPSLPVAVVEWDAVTETAGATLWSGGVPAPASPFFEFVFVDTTAAAIHLDAGDFFLLRVGDAAQDLTGWDLSSNQGWDQATTMFVALYPHLLYLDGIDDPFERLVFQTWFLEAQIGTPYCSSNPNSTGVSATLRAMGSTTAAQNDVRLIAESLPTSAFGFFLASTTPALVLNPGGSQGNLCVGGSIGRYVGPGQIQNAGSTGVISLTLDLTQVPSPTGFVAVQAGETWNFQAWYRDAIGGTATSNFTNGLEINFL